ncbi:putative ATP-grasp-modified RiPP [Streptacidiphilus pinicola]|nr:putative ATP-grasp-modified RiPP [Streptacidiphilus pinicola]
MTTLTGTTNAPWGLRRMEPMRNNSGGQAYRHAGLDPETQTSIYLDEQGLPIPAWDGKHGTSVNTYPPTQISKDGQQDPDSGHDAQQDQGGD